MNKYLKGFLVEVQTFLNEVKAVVKGLSLLASAKPDNVNKDSLPELLDNIDALYTRETQMNTWAVKFEVSSVDPEVAITPVPKRVRRASVKK